MKKSTTLNYIALMVFGAVFSMSSCKKDSTSVEDTNTISAEFQAVSAGSTSTFSSTNTNSSTDSIYVLGCYPPKGHLTVIAVADLPASITTYLTANYAGYTAIKFLKVTNQNNGAEGFVGIIKFNDKPVGLKFDSNGAFVRVLEQREGKDLKKDNGWHLGGLFDNRDGKHRDTLALTALPLGVKTYFAANYTQDTLQHAVVNRDGSIIVLSLNKGIYATMFSSTSVFIKRMQLPAHQGKDFIIAQSALPARALTYLSATYPNYIFNRAYEIKANGTLQGYVAFIDANGTKYSIQFEASGTFIRAVAVR